MSVYFDQHTNHYVLGRLADALAPDGYLVLGAAETVLGRQGTEPCPFTRHLCSQVLRAARSGGKAKNKGAEWRPSLDGGFFQAPLLSDRAARTAAPHGFDLVFALQPFEFLAQLAD